MSENLEEKIGCTKDCRKIEVPAEGELNALNELRCIKNQVREVKKKISDLSAGALAEAPWDDLMDLEKQMADLKEKWLVWEEKRQQAARERMITLGHEDPEPK